MRETLGGLTEEVPEGLRGALEAFLGGLPVDGDASGDIWTAPALRDLPRYATTPGLPSALIEEAREAHRLGVLHAWHVQRGETSGEDARLRGFLFERWRDALVRSARMKGSRVVDRVSQAMRWMGWGLSNTAMAHRAGRWTLPEYHRTLRWRTSAQSLATLLMVERVAPGKRAGFERAYEQLVRGLSQTTSAVAAGSVLHQLLRCERADLIRGGLLDLQLAAIDAEAAGFDRLASFCRAHAEATDEIDDVRARVREEAREARSKRPTAPALKSGSRRER